MERRSHCPAPTLPMHRGSTDRMPQEFSAKSFRGPLRAAGPDPSELMQLGRARLTPEERQRRVASCTCLYCGEDMGEPNIDFFSCSFAFSCHCPVGSQSLGVNAFIDSGADECFMDSALLKQLVIPTCPLQTPNEATALDGHSVGRIAQMSLSP